MRKGNQLLLLNSQWWLSQVFRETKILDLNLHQSVPMRAVILSFNHFWSHQALCTLNKIQFYIFVYLLKPNYYVFGDLFMKFWFLILLQIQTNEITFSVLIWFKTCFTSTLLLIVIICFTHLPPLAYGLQLILFVGCLPPEKILKSVN